MAQLSADLPELRCYVTLSPVPGFAAWLATQDDAAELRGALAGGWDDDAVERLRPQVLGWGARYIAQAKARGGLPADPVARFHLGNGACAHRLNWPADLAPSALKSAHGLMINYLYELDRIEDRHEAFVRDGEVALGAQIAEALKA